MSNEQTKCAIRLYYTPKKPSVTLGDNLFYEISESDRNRFNIPDWAEYYGYFPKNIPCGDWVSCEEFARLESIYLDEDWE